VYGVEEGIVRGQLPSKLKYRRKYTFKHDVTNSFGGKVKTSSNPFIEDNSMRTYGGVMAERYHY
jgi:hypothetical protein